MNIRVLTLILILWAIELSATDYHVGPSQSFSTIAEVPWASLMAGDRVFIHWKDTHYYEKWVINRQGTESERIEIIGVSGPNGEQPVIDGNGAVTPLNLNYWNDSRGVIKIGGSSVPADGLPSYLTIENLEIRSGQPDYQFTDDNGNLDTYSNNAAAIYIEKGSHLIIRNCTLHDSGNGLFIGAFDGQTQDILIEKNYIYGNGVVGDFLEHNAYTEAIDITYQFNHFGPLRDGADGNNLKDRSAGLVVRFNWIEGGNRQLDMVDAEGSQNLVLHPSYSTTHVYGNILIEPDGAGNSQIAHYGGDSGTTDDYRKGDLYFYNNTVVSTRSGFTTLVRLSTNDETAHVLNNVLYVTAAGENLALIEGSGTLLADHNWLKDGWQDCHCTPTGSVNDSGTNLTGSDPLFENQVNQEFRPLPNSSLVDGGTPIPSFLALEHDVQNEYVQHLDSVGRPFSGPIDIGAYEYGDISSGLVSTANDEEVRVFPNPTEDRLYFTAREGEYGEVHIYDILGQLSARSWVVEGTVDVSFLTSGLYTLTMFDGNRLIRVQFVRK